MNWANFGSIGWLAVAILGFITWGIQKKATDSATERIKEEAIEADAVKRRLAEYDARTERIVKAALAQFENDLFIRINGTYVRAKEHQAQFDRLREFMVRIEKQLDLLQQN